MGFAMTSEEWRSKYDFQIVPNHQRPVMGVASHKLGKCEIPKKTLRDRDAGCFCERRLLTSGSTRATPRPTSRTRSLVY